MEYEINKNFKNVTRNNNVIFQYLWATTSKYMICGETNITSSEINSNRKADLINIQERNPVEITN